MIQKIDILYSNVYMLGAVINATTIPFMQLFEYFEPTGIPEIDDLFVQFQTKGSELGNEKFFLDATQRVVEEYPEAIFLETLIKNWLHIDMNVFFYGASKIAVTYVIVRHVQSGGKLTDLMKVHIASDLVAGSSPKSSEYLAQVHPDLKMASSDATFEIISLDALFPDQEITDQYELPVALQEKIQRSYLETLSPDADVDLITNMIRQYRSVLAS